MVEASEIAKLRAAVAELVEGLRDGVELIDDYCRPGVCRNLAGLSYFVEDWASAARGLIAQHGGK